MEMDELGVILGHFCLYHRKHKTAVISQIRKIEQDSEIIYRILCYLIQQRINLLYCYYSFEMASIIRQYYSKILIICYGN